MVPDIHNFSIIHDNNFVSRGTARKTMGNDYYGFILIFFHKRVHKILFGNGVK